MFFSAAIYPAIGGLLNPAHSEGTLRRTAWRGVKRNIGMFQEGNVISLDVKIAPVNVGHMGEGVEIFDWGTIGIVDNGSILSVRDAYWRFALSELDEGSRILFGRQNQLPSNPTAISLEALSREGRQKLF